MCETGARINEIANSNVCDVKLKVRHYVATNLHYNFKMDLDHVARLLGDTQKTISSRYLHPTAEMLHNLMNKASGW